MKKVLFIMIAMISLTSCVKYYTDNRPGPICNIDTHLKPDSIYTIYDSIAPMEKWDPSFSQENPEHFNGMASDVVKSRIYYFDSSPKEMYYVEFRHNLSIVAVYNMEERSWLYNDKLDDKEKERICKRFKEEIITKSESYSKRRNHADSGSIFLEAR